MQARVAAEGGSDLAPGQGARVPNKGEDVYQVRR
jgi:hypothetical protein